MIIGIEAAHANKERKTGVENVCFALIQELKKQIPSDTRVILYSSEPLRGGLENLPANWQVKVLAWPLKKLWSQIRLSLELLFNPPDVFFAPGQLIPFFTPKKTISIIHDSAFLVYPEAYNFWGRQYLKWMNKRILKKSSEVITSSEFNKNEIKKYYGERASNKTAVIPFAYDKEIFKISEEKDGEILKKYGITKSFIMSVGRLEKKKNTVNIVRAFNVLKKYNDIQLLLVGNPGVGFQALEDEIEKSPYKNDIILAGWVGSGDTPYLLNKARVFVFPSLYEGFGLPVLEAMSCGCPVVASDILALREVGGDAAVYANKNNPEELAERINRLLTDEIWRDDKIQAGIARAKNFLWENTVKKIVDVL